MNLKSIPRYGWTISYCPRVRAELGSCIGRCHLFAFLHVTGNVIGATYAGGQPTPVVQNVDAKILPFKMIIPFMIVDDGCIRDDFVVRKCREAWEDQRNGPGPEKWSDHTPPINPEMVYDRASAPIVKLADVGKCLEVRASFLWMEGLLTAGFGGSGSASGQAGGSVTVGGAPVISGQGSASGSASGSGGASVGGKTTPLEVVFTICYGDGCYTVPFEPGGTADAERVYAAGKIVS